MDGVMLTPLRRIPTGKGDVMHALRCTDAGYAGFGEVYFSEVMQGVRKGWKRHNRMTLNVVVVRGSIRFYIYDDRAGSATKGEMMTVVLSDKDNYQRLTLSAGLWMAFEGVGEGVSLLMDVIDKVHDPQEADTKPIEDIKIEL